VRIKFGTDGWRAIIAEDFTVENVRRVADATARWLLTTTQNPSVVIGHDCRFGGELFAGEVADIMLARGIKTYLAEGFVSTPMISMGTVELKASLGIIITASHNPPMYNGFKLKGSFGGPLQPALVQQMEDLIPDKVDKVTISRSEALQNDQLIMVDLESMYCDKVASVFDIEAIRNSGLKLAFDAMYGAGQNVIRRLLPECFLLHCDYNPSFMGQAPEPIHRNLTEFSQLIRTSGKFDCGLVTDGDADRLGLYDSKGNFIDSHHIILLLIHYLVKYKGIKGKVCTAFSTSEKVKTMCQYYGLELETVKIGFKYICEIMINEDVLLGGEESGGIAIKGHIPERDGIWMGMVLWEFMAKTGKRLEDLIDEVYQITGTFAFERSDLHLDETTKIAIVKRCAANEYSHFGPYKVIRIDDLDGHKFFFENGDWMMIRASGTEPVLRTYAESDTRENAFAILEAARTEILSL
jgi:phosphomannomutase